MIIAGSILLILLVTYISIDNRFKRVKVGIEQSISGIDAALTRRFDMLTKLVDVTKQYMKFENDTLSKVIKLRSNYGEMNLKDKSAFEGELSKLASGINVTMENYPELKSSEVVVELQEAVVTTEDDLYASRRMYNSNVAIYNELITVFPSSIIANARNYHKEEFFEAEAHKKEDVSMKLF